jgi:hypothetical protein
MIGIVVVVDMWIARSLTGRFPDRLLSLLYYPGSTKQWILNCFNVLKMFNNYNYISLQQ